MRITINGITTDRGNSQEERAAAGALVTKAVRPRYTTQAKRNAKAYQAPKQEAKPFTPWFGHHLYVGINERGANREEREQTDFYVWLRRNFPALTNYATKLTRMGELDAKRYAGPGTRSKSPARYDAFAKAQAA